MTEAMTIKPITVGELLTTEFLEPQRITHAALAEAMGVRRSDVRALCEGETRLTTETALVLARVFGNSAEYWLGTQMRTDLWEALSDPLLRARVEEAKVLARPAAAEAEPDAEQTRGGGRKFTVRRRVDAFVDSIAEVEAATAEEAAELAREHEDDFDWMDEDTETFDARMFITLDDKGWEIDGTQCGDF